MKPLIEYEMRRTFTLKTLIGLLGFVIVYAGTLQCIGGLFKPLQETLLNETYIQSHYLYYSTFIINYALLAWANWMSMSLFFRGDEDIALLMRTSRGAMWCVKTLIGIGFLLVMTSVLLLVNHGMLIKLNMTAFEFSKRFAAQAITLVYYFTWFSLVALIIKSPRPALFVMPLVFIVDTFIPAVKQHESPFTAILSVIFPMVEPSGRMGFIHPALWATLMLSGIISLLTFFMMREKAF